MMEYRIRGRSGGRTADIIRFFKAHPKGRIVVPDLCLLDILVSQGIQPSQIIVSSEYRDTSRFDML